MTGENAQLLAQDLADAIAQMDEKKRYNELLLFVETCEASTMWKRVYSPRVLGMASSILGEPPSLHPATSPSSSAADGGFAREGNRIQKGFVRRSDFVEFRWAMGASFLLLRLGVCSAT